MDVITKVEKKAKKASEILKYKVICIPGVTEDLDQYKVTHELLNITCYGSSEESALASAKMEAEARFMEQASLADKILTQAAKDHLLVKRKPKKKFL